jgi:uncharacterized protein with ATP-grasp and redox domains
VIVLKQCPDKHGLYQKILNEVLNIMQQADTSKPPAYTTTFIHRAIREILGADPFKKIKYDYNNKALGLYEELKYKVRNSRDPLWTASRIAIAGNIIDFGIFTTVDVEGSLKRALESCIAIDDYQYFKEALQETDDVLYLLDNSGEIVFDKVLIEELVSSGKRVKAVVKGSPVLNDVTYEDAVQIGLADTCDIIDNGSDAVGTFIEWTSSDFQKEFDTAKIIISKGQGNFETLAGLGKKTFFLFQSKCDVVSKDLNLSNGSMLLKKP